MNENDLSYVTETMIADQREQIESEKTKTLRRDVQRYSEELGGYVDYMSPCYLEECSRVKKLIGEAVLYNRQNGGLSDSQGIAVYLPVNVNELHGLVYFLDYVYNISDDDIITALYYYKQAGCLPDVLKEKV
ncbi:MAG: hypothetical protein Q4F25_06180, partial [Eubacteriales bacterium]|nr:hypothetical protein [Eubacteriales bacterium]